ncbi:hypothetical protein GGR54DRAFT_339940 [Hypoxylon sp. NC1633]|nr:hypothetical protein GGR54DRAFT_339940 [Hypoxylon sp. NC1633]
MSLMLTFESRYKFFSRYLWLIPSTPTFIRSPATEDPKRTMVTQVNERPATYVHGTDVSDSQQLLQLDPANLNRHGSHHAYVDFGDIRVGDTYNEKMMASSLILAPQADNPMQMQAPQLRDSRSPHLSSPHLRKNSPLQTPRQEVCIEPSLRREAAIGMKNRTRVAASASLPPTNNLTKKANTSRNSNASNEALRVLSGPTEVGTGLEGNDQSPFRDPLPIPHVSPQILVYPHSASKITTAYHDRYVEIVNIFRQNTLEDPRLSNHAKHIDYGLKLCGLSEQNAHPSILVFCRPQEFKSLKRLFDQEHLKAQYLERTTRKSLWHSMRNREDEQEPRRPLFKLYFWRAQRPRTLLWGGQDNVRIGSESATASSRALYMYDHSLTMCGSPIYQLPGGSRVSTLGCVLQIGSQFYGLTAAHGIRCCNQRSRVNGAEKDAVRHTGLSHSEKPKRDEFTSISFNKEEYNDLPSDDDDVVYESLSDDESYDSDSCDEEDYVDSWASSQSVKAEPKEGYAKVEEMRQVISTVTAMYPPADAQDLDLDWALVLLDRSDQWRPNVFFNRRTSSHLAFIPPVAAGVPKYDTEVLVILPSRITKHGVIQPTAAFLGGINGNTSSQVWCVKLTGQQVLSHGDSGSMVVDAETFAIYGHVIGSNPLGEIYISPLSSTLEQIKGFFPTHMVSLPDPRPLMAKLATHYFRLYDYTKSQLQVHYFNQFHQFDPSKSLKAAEAKQELLKLHEALGTVFNQQHKATFARLLGQKGNPKAAYNLRVDLHAGSGGWGEILERQLTTRLKNIKFLSDSAVLDDDDKMPVERPKLSQVKKLPRSSGSTTPTAPLPHTMNVREHMIEAPRFPRQRSRRVS